MMEYKYINTPAVPYHFYSVDPGMLCDALNGFYLIIFHFKYFNVHDVYRETWLSTTVEMAARLLYVREGVLDLKATRCH